MNEQNLLEELKVLVTRRQSKQFYADRLGVTVAEVESLLKELREEKQEEMDVEELQVHLKSIAKNQYLLVAQKFKKEMHQMRERYKDSSEIKK